MRIIVFLLIFSLFSCQEEVTLDLPEEKLVSVIRDMLMSETAITRVPSSEHDSLRTVYYNQIYEIHGIDSISFARNLKILSQLPELSIEIYGKVEVELETLRKAHGKKK